MEYNDYLNLFTVRAPQRKKIGRNTYASFTPAGTLPPFDCDSVAISFHDLEIVRVRATGGFCVDIHGYWSSPTTTQRLNCWLPYGGRFESVYIANNLGFHTRVLRAHGKTYPFQDAHWWSSNYLRDDLPASCDGRDFGPVSRIYEAGQELLLRLYRGKLHEPAVADWAKEKEPSVLPLLDMLEAPLPASLLMHAKGAHISTRDLFIERRTWLKSKETVDTRLDFIEKKLIDPRTKRYDPRLYYPLLRREFFRWLYERLGFFLY